LFHTGVGGEVFEWTPSAASQILGMPLQSTGLVDQERFQVDGPDGYGPICVMIARRAVKTRPRSGSVTRPIAKASAPQAHLQPFTVMLQADGYAGFNGLYDRDEPR
jgi:hypothetical protein